MIPRRKINIVPKDIIRIVEINTILEDNEKLFFMYSLKFFFQILKIPIDSKSTVKPSPPKTISIEIVVIYP